jgi:inositol oxygenase
VANKCTLPAEALAMIRYHSAYPWHTGGAYREFMTARDEEMMKWVLTFNKYDLYTKTEFEDDFASIRDNLDDLWRYYEQIIAKYFPEPNLMW